MPVGAVRNASARFARRGAISSVSRPVAGCASAQAVWAAIDYRHYLPKLARGLRNGNGPSGSPDATRRSSFQSRPNLTHAQARCSQLRPLLLGAQEDRPFVPREVESSSSTFAITPEA